MQRLLLTLAKLAVSAALLAYVVIAAQRSDPEIFTRLRETAPQWSLVLLGWVCLAASLSAGVLRWHAVLRALGVSTRLRQLFRSAIFAIALDFVALGVAGGDLVKGLLVARDHPGRRPLILTSVLIDRVVGLHGLLTIGAFILIAINPLRSELDLLRDGLITAAVGLNLSVLLLWRVPGLGRLIERHSHRFGRFGEVLTGLVPALRQVRDHPWSMLPVVPLNFAALFFLISGCFLVAKSLPGEAPTFAEQWQILPLAMVSDLIPLPGGNLGALDFAMSYLYQHITAGRVPLGQGLLVVMLTRLINVIISLIAVALYATSGERLKP